MHREELITKFSERIPVLDKGHVRLVDVMGDDIAIVQAARVSYGKGHSEHKWNDSQTLCTVCGAREAGLGHIPDHCLEGDRKLIRYLMENRHTSPLEMCEIKLHCKMPIFVARQWIRHRTANVNEISGRYTILPDEYYVPDIERIGGKGLLNKQSTEGLASMSAEDFLSSLNQRYTLLRNGYMAADNGGVSNELARLHTGVGQYTEWYWKIDLHNLLHFLGLRMEAHAQWETRMYANAISEIVKAWCPFAWEAFVDYRLEAVTFSRQEIEAVRLYFRTAESLDMEIVRGIMNSAGLEDSKRTRAGFLRKIGVIE